MEESSVDEQGDLASSCLSRTQLLEEDDASSSAVSSARLEAYRTSVKRKGDLLVSTMGISAAVHHLVRICLDSYGRPEIKPSDSIRRENLLFRMKLRPCDIKLLLLRGEVVRSHFPGVANNVFQGLACLTFTDAQNKQWCSHIIKSGKAFDVYALVSGWESFTKEYNLECGDVVKFYKPDQALGWGEGLFLIDYKRRNPTGTSTKRQRRRENTSSLSAINS